MMQKPQELQQQQQQEGNAAEREQGRADSEQQLIDPNVLFELSLLYYRTVTQETKSANIAYDTKIDLSALYKQATVGPYDPDRHESPGFFDFVGKDRVAAWKTLEDLSIEEAKTAFSELLREKVPEFEGWLQGRLAQKRERERREKELKEKEAKRIAVEHRRRQQELAKEQKEAELQRQKAALEAREAMLRERRRQEEAARQAMLSIVGVTFDEQGKVSAECVGTLVSDEFIAQFKKATGESADSHAVVTNGEVLTVRVPAPSDGPARIIWQMCTDDYDISFGVDYEVKGQEEGSVQVQNVMPVEKIDSHKQVVTGTDVSKAPGVWLLRFDNSYSYFRSKTIYYRVFVNKLSQDAVQQPSGRKPHTHRQLPPTPKATSPTTTTSSEAKQSGATRSVQQQQQQLQQQQQQQNQ